MDMHWNVGRYEIPVFPEKLLMMGSSRLFFTSWCHREQGRLRHGLLKESSTFCNAVVLWVTNSANFGYSSLSCPCPDHKLLSGSLPQITSAGFQFLLHPPHAQLWDLLLQYLHMAEAKWFMLADNEKTDLRFNRKDRWIWSRSSLFFSCYPRWNSVVSVFKLINFFSSLEFWSRNILQKI